MKRLKFSVSRSNIKIKVTKSNMLVPLKGSVTTNSHMKYQSPSIYYLKDIGMVKVFNMNMNHRGQGQICWYPQKGLVKGNTHVKYQSPSTIQKIYPRLKFLISRSNTKVKPHSRSQSKFFGTHEKVL
jgi:hypothetical protein